MNISIGLLKEIYNKKIAFFMLKLIEEKTFYKILIF